MSDSVMTYDELYNKVSNVKNVAFSVSYAIAGNPNGSLYDILQTILNVLNSVVNAVQNKLNEYLGVIVYFANSVINSLTNIIDKIRNLVENLIETFMNAFWDVFSEIISIFSYFVNTIISFVKTEITQLINSFETALNKIVERIALLTNNVVTVVENIIDNFKKIVSDIVNSIINIAKNVYDAIVEFGNKIKQAIVTAYESVTETVKRELNKLLSEIREAIDNVRDMFVDMYTSIVTFITEKFRPLLADSISDIGSGTTKIAAVAADAMLGRYKSYDAFMADLIPSNWDASIITKFVGMFIFAIIFLPQIGVITQPAATNILHLANEKFRPSLPSPSDAIQMFFRNLINEEEFVNLMGLEGYADEYHFKLLNASRPLLSPGDIQIAYLRNEISESEHDRMLMAHGYTLNDIELFKKLYYIIPPVQDLISMAVREVFSPETAEKFGQFEDFPKDFEYWANKVGLSPVWAKNYWAAHWRLPSENMAFEMLHRNIINEEELKLLLKALDIMPFWREKLIQLSYVPYTRVDIRRMYQLGVLSYDEVIKAYKEIGYEQSRAEKLAEFTVKYCSKDEETELDEYKKLSREIYIKAYKRNIISREELIQNLKLITYSDEDAELLANIADAEISISDTAIDFNDVKEEILKKLLYAFKKGIYSKNEFEILLSDLGYTSDEIGWFTNLTEFEYMDEIINDVVDAVHELYVSRTIDKTEATIRLQKYVLVSSEFDRLFEKWDIERELRTRKPTEAQFRAALQRSLISIDIYKEELRGLGYEEKYVELLAKMATT